MASTDFDLLVLFAMAVDELKAAIVARDGEGMYHAVRHLISARDIVMDQL